MQLTSAIRISRPAPEVLDALLDAGTVAACLPGSRLIGEVADNTYAGELRLRIGPVHAVYAGTVRLDNADRDAGTATLHASGWERGGQGRADASVTLRVESRGASTRVLISADLMIRGKVAEYAPGAIGDVGQRLVEQFAGNVEQLLASQAGAPPASTGPPVSTGPPARGSTGGCSPPPRCCWPAGRWRPAPWPAWRRGGAVTRTQLRPYPPIPPGPSPTKGHAMTNPTAEGAQPELRPLQIEANGINVITDAERKGHPRDLFWPWFAANVSVLGLGYGAFVLDFGVSFWQAVIARADRDRRLVPALRVHRGGRQAGLGADHGAGPGRVRGPRQQAPLADLLAAHGGLGDRADHPGHAGHRHRVRAARLGRRHRGQGDRADRGERADRDRRRDGLRPDHAHAVGDHLGHRRADRGVHHPGGRQDPLAHRVRHPGRARRRSSSARWCS